MAQIVRTANIPTSDQKAALDAATAGANPPTAANPIVTQDSLAGAGLGDVTGPAGAVSGNFPTLDETGKILADSGMNGSSFLASNVTAEGIGADYLHGVASHGAITFDATEHTLTVAGAVDFWFAGTRVYTANAIVCDLDLEADRDHVSATLTSNTLYFIYAKDATAKLYWSPTPWGIDLTKVPFATIFWNGTIGAVQEETHGHRRDLEWHKNAHLTIGARISSADFAMTSPSVAAPTAVNFAGGTLYDEDHSMTYANNTPAGMLLNCRVWYQVAAGQFTFVNSDAVYPAGGVSFVDSDTGPYTLTAINANQYANIWLYASPDTQRPIYAVLETRTSAHTTVASARAVTPPSLLAMGISTELKLLYRVIMQGDETFVEFTDYRASASLPAGGTTAPSAAGVTFAPSGAIAASNVQAALEELDSEKVAAATYDAHTILAATTNDTPVALTVTEQTVVGRLTGGNISAIGIGTGSTNVAAGNHTHTVTDRIVAVFDGGGSEIADAKQVRVMMPFACTITKATILADQSGSIVVDVWKDTYANYPPTVADTITASAKPTVTTATKSEDATLTGWTTSIAAGDCLIFNVDSCTTITHATVVLTVTRSA